ncbi:cytochrome P450 [Dactylosporangium sp. NPDC048998]|uniref:cytochrome P450 n=1 Tax=Dactylosporangium sp. NPDC048998 TaxID=3363976 RepID=UPI00371A6203
MNAEPGTNDLRTVGNPERITTADGSAWMLRRYHDVVTALTGNNLSACPRHAAGDDYRGYELPPAFQDNIISAEPEDHRRLRQLVAPLMDRSAAQSIRPALQRAAAGAFANASALGRFDLVQDFTGPYVAAAAAAWLGLDGPQRADYLAWAARLVGPEWATLRGRDTLPTMVSLVEDLANNPGDPRSTIGRLLTMRDTGHMRATETTAMIFYLLFVWYEISVNAVTAAVIVASESDQGRPWTRHWRRHADEALRRYTPQTIAFRRFAMEDQQTPSGVIKAGQTVFMSLAAANKDLSSDLQDADRRHLSFGYGAHRCPGQSIALAIIREALAVAGDAKEIHLQSIVWTAGLRTYGARQIEVDPGPR